MPTTDGEDPGHGPGGPEHGAGEPRADAGRPAESALPRRSSRRAVLAALGVGAVGAGLGWAGFEQLRRVWWQVPGIDKPRKPGELDYAAAGWAGASEANWRRADRPADYGIDRVVIHVTEGSYAVALQVFSDPGHGAATHYVVRAEDGHVAQTVRELDVAFHAGNREWNERSVGIEHEGFVDRPETLTDVMYRSSAKLTADICRRYDIPVDREHIVGHNEVPEATHTDPGPHWDWRRYMRLVREAHAAADREASTRPARDS
ncbi:N-acetylmuramoyl-L-alanine amidase [Streptomyces sp. 184]|uniref:N-acetylmuramoyl-L-alanine amidase n=1 Tax=Streptomyces sp. 184 TaxID=1827526 RepID=UPI0038928770